jgi:hypothetical protein
LRFCEDWDLLLRLRERGAFVYVPGEIGIEYSLRLAANDNTGSIFDANRRAALDYLSAQYGLPHLQPKNYLDVALGLGFTVESLDGSAQTMRNDHAELYIGEEFLRLLGADDDEIHAPIEDDDEDESEDRNVGQGKLTE